MPKTRILAYTAMLSAVAIWGVAGPVIKATLTDLPPFTFLFYRFLVASFFCLPILAYQWKRREVGTGDFAKLFLLGLMSTTINLSLIFLGFERTTALDGTLISAITPIFIVVGGVVFLKEKITRLEKIGLMVVLLGTITTVVQPLIEGGTFARENLLGNLLILAAGLEWTAYIILAKEDFKRHSPLVITTSGSLVGLATFLPIAFWETGLKFEPTPLAIFGVLYMAILSYVLAYFLYNFAASKIEISEVAIFAYLQPLFAAPLAVFWLGETITPTFLAGALVIAVGVVITEYRPPQEKGEKTPPVAPPKHR
jgi:drug/metabolite transporter (DMT)-like permease